MHLLIFVILILLAIAAAHIARELSGGPVPAESNGEGRPT